jgi:diadenosine tetraphosphatase ApaH/serine/threonine PP2A family protein phosphatase
VRVMGNHEYAVRFPDELQFNPDAQAAVEWTRDVLDVADLVDRATDLPMHHKEDDLLFVHGSVKNRILDYVHSEDPSGYSTFDTIAKTLEESFVGFRLCFVGHNHLPFLATEEGFIHPHQSVDEFYVAGRKLYVCVGSVGQPRDGDTRASFVVYNGETVKYHRVPYDATVTARKIRDERLPKKLADRLLMGR